MRAIFSVLGLILVLAIVGVLAKRQLSAVTAPVQTSLPSTAGTEGAASRAAATRPAQLPGQVQQDLNQVMQQRPSQLEQDK